MKTILLMRHAKSSWSHGGLDDHARPLNARGRESSDAMALWLVRNNNVPDLAMVSSAARTQETWTRMVQFLPAGAVMKTHRSLYHAGPDTMLDLLQSTADSVQCAMVLAHQPGMSAATSLFCKDADSSPFAHGIRDFPTAAIAVLNAPIDTWQALDFDSCTLAGFPVPGSVMAGDA